MKIYDLFLDGDRQVVKQVEEVKAKTETCCDIVDSINALDALGMRSFAKERMYMLCLTQKNKIIGVYEVGTGTESGCLVDIKTIMTAALQLGATRIIVSHNHPRGSAVPSREDITVTERLQEACNLLCINFCDHIIIGQTDYYSFREKGALS